MSADHIEDDDFCEVVLESHRCPGCGHLVPDSNRGLHELRCEYASMPILSHTTEILGSVNTTNPSAFMGNSNSNTRTNNTTQMESSSDVDDVPCVNPSSSNYTSPSLSPRDNNVNRQSQPQRDYINLISDDDESDDPRPSTHLSRSQLRSHDIEGKSRGQLQQSPQSGHLYPVSQEESGKNDVHMTDIDGHSVDSWEFVNERFRTASIGAGEGTTDDRILCSSNNEKHGWQSNDNTGSDRLSRRGNMGSALEIGSGSDSEVLVADRDSVDCDERENEGWNCPRCTFQNHAAVPDCEMCQYPRPAGSVNAHMQVPLYDMIRRLSGRNRDAAANAEYGRLNGIRSDADIDGRLNGNISTSESELRETRETREWTCSKCTFQNDSVDNSTHCSMCRTTRIGARRHSSSSASENDGDIVMNDMTLIGGLVGAAAGGILSFLTGQRIAPAMYRGAISGAVGGSISASSRLGSGQIQSYTTPFGGSRVVFRTLSTPDDFHSYNTGFDDDLDNVPYEEMMQRFPSRGRPANPGIIHALPTEQLSRASVAKMDQHNNSCCICLDDYVAGSNMKRLPCLHRFHDYCIDEWLQRNGTCPVCKHTIE
eukprot:CFRG6255T1